MTRTKETGKFNMVQVQKRVYSLQKRSRRFVVLGRVRYFSPVKSAVAVGSEVTIQYRPHPVSGETMSVTLCLEGGAKERWWALDDIAEMKSNLGKRVIATMATEAPAVMAPETNPEST